MLPDFSLGLGFLDGVSSINVAFGLGKRVIRTATDKVRRRAKIGFYRCQDP